MTAKFFALNCSKTECLLNDLKQQPAKIHTSSPVISHSVRHLDLIFGEHTNIHTYTYR